MHEFDEICAEHAIEQKLASVAALCFTHGIGFDDDDVDLEIVDALNTTTTTTIATNEMMDMNCGRDDNTKENIESDAANPNALLSKSQSYRKTKYRRLGEGMACEIDPVAESTRRRVAAKQKEIARLRRTLRDATVARESSVANLTNVRDEAKKIVMELQR